VSAVADESGTALLARLWRDPAAWITTADILAVLTAVSLPWSTSLVAIFATAFLVSIVPFFDAKAFLQRVRRPICTLPLALFCLAVAGTLWSDAAWGARLYAIGPTLKLLMLPVLFYHFERSGRGLWVFSAFLIACALLMVLSWIVLFVPQLTIKPVSNAGVPVKNYIDQSQEFALCAVALAYPTIALLRTKRVWQPVLLVALSLSFVGNMVFVVVSRTALVTIPVMSAVFVLIHLKWRSIFVMFGVMALFAGLAWTISPHLRATATTFLMDYQLYKEKNLPTSGGLRLEYWKKSVQFLAEAPILGHGTGSTRGLFERAALGQTGASADVVGNPHNQTLNMAVQWGAVGIIALYAMWFVHLRMFRGDGMANWIGLLVVVQNIFTSLFNSHLFDFHEGWMYVLGVGVAGGMALKNSSCDAAAGAERPGRS
jgi:O-antigen ligase